MNEIEKFEKICENVEKLSQEKIRYEERYKAEKEKLEALVKEIEGKGFDPKNLSDIKSKMELSLKEDIEKLEKLVADISGKLSTIEEVSA